MSSPNRYSHPNSHQGVEAPLTTHLDPRPPKPARRNARSSLLEPAMLSFPRAEALWSGGPSRPGPISLDSLLEDEPSSHHEKRQRMSDPNDSQVGETHPVTEIDENKPPSQRLVLLVADLIPITGTARRTRNMNSRDKQPREVILFIPEHIIRKIPKYEFELDEQMENVEDKGQTFEIADFAAHHQVPFVRAIEYVSGAQFPSIKASESNDNVQRTLTELLGVYAVSIELEIKTLEDSVLAHIECRPDLSTEAFLAFARTVYAGDVDKGLAAHAIDSSIGKLIKRKLAVLLPRLLHDGTVRTIKAEGGTLSNELLEVIIDHCSGKEGIKVED